MFRKIKIFFKKLIPSKRKIIQLYAALLFNANIKGFVNGKIFEGLSKTGCVPGLNCYSCPGAIGACPLGSLQNALSESKTKLPTYILGIILLYSIILGRTICGFLCPFGLIQELLYKIKTPKLRKNKVTRVLSYFKYVILIVLVIIIPLIYGLQSMNIPLPGFCKYICPAGTLGGAISLLSNPNNTDFFGMLGGLFTWKFLLLVIFLVSSVFIFRFFCRFFCPLGAIYGIFNKLSILGVKVDKEKCTHCNACINHCKMDVKEVGDHECIQCGECRNVCHCNAISWKSIREAIKKDKEKEQVDNTEEVIIENNKKTKRKNIIISIVMAIVLVVAIVLPIVFEKEENIPIGNQVGELCINKEIPLIGSEDTFSVEKNKGKITIINFWYTSCTPCVQELPHFNSLYEEYKDNISVIAIHEANMYIRNPESVSDFIESHFGDFTIMFGYDDPENPYYTMLGGKRAWPVTVIVDQKGVISFVQHGSLTESELRAEIEKLIK